MASSLTQSLFVVDALLDIELACNSFVLKTCFERKETKNVATYIATKRLILSFLVLDLLQGSHLKTSVATILIFASISFSLDLNLVATSPLGTSLVSNFMLSFGSALH